MKPRRDKMEPSEIEAHHVWSRCAQQEWLLTKDPRTGRDCSHRREWMVSLSEYLATVFAIDVGGEHFVSNHYHQSLRNRPDIASRWSPEETAWRFRRAYPQLINGVWQKSPTDKEIDSLLLKEKLNPGYIAELQRRLSSISWHQGIFKRLISFVINRDHPPGEERRGTLWEGRFGNRRLETQDEIVTVQLYIDLQQVANGAASSVETSSYSSIQKHILSRAEEAFVDLHGRSPNDRSEEDMKELEGLRTVAACYFAPITDRGLLMTQPDDNPPQSELLLPAGYVWNRNADDAPLATDEAAGDSESDQGTADAPDAPDELGDGAAGAGDTSDDRAQHASHEDEHGNESSGAENPGTSGDAAGTATTSVRRPASTKQHRELSRRLRRRASRNPIMGTDWGVYYALLKALEAKLLAERHGGPAPTSPAKPPNDQAATIARDPSSLSLSSDARVPMRALIQGFAERLASWLPDLPPALSDLLRPASRGDPDVPGG